MPHSAWKTILHKDAKKKLRAFELRRRIEGLKVPGSQDEEARAEMFECPIGHSKRDALCPVCPKEYSGGCSMKHLKHIEDA